MSRAAGEGGAGGPLEMSFWDHLDALRGVILRSAVAVLAGMALCFAFAAYLQDLLVMPYARAAARIGPTAGTLALLTPTEGFLVRIKLALFGGLLLGSPVVFWQLWTFVAPGLHASEKRLVLPITLAASLLFLMGAVFGWHIMGLATEFLLAFATPSIGNLWSLGSYLSFTAQIMLGLGLAFQLPLVLMLLVRLGVLATAQLSRWRRHAVVGILVAVALLPMQDPLSLVLMSGPLYVLYELSILGGRLVERRRRSEGDGAPRAARRDEERP